MSAPPGPQPPPSNRWLLIVQTSAPMQPRATAVRQIAADMVASGVHGQMRPGDTLGLWTYNDRLYTGRFPLQEWSPGASDDIAGRLYHFLQNQSYEKQSPSNVFLPYLNGLIRSSDMITIILMSDGREKMQGTPFDRAINATYESWKQQQEQSNLPFITVLRAQHGRMIQYSVGVPPWPLDLPPLPASPVEAAQTTPVRPVRRRAQAVPPLIIIGDKAKSSSREPAATNSAVAPQRIAPRATATTESTAAVHPAAVGPASLTATGPAGFAGNPLETHAARPAPAASSGPAGTESQISVLNSKDRLIVVVLALACLVTVGIALRIRSSRSNRASLITRSLERKDNPPS